LWKLEKYKRSTDNDEELRVWPKSRQPLRFPIFPQFHKAFSLTHHCSPTIPSGPYNTYHSHNSVYPPLFPTAPTIPQLPQQLHATSPHKFLPQCHLAPTIPYLCPQTLIVSTSHCFSPNFSFSPTIPCFLSHFFMSGRSLFSFPVIYSLAILHSFSQFPTLTSPYFFPQFHTAPSVSIHFHGSIFCL